MSIADSILQIVQDAAVKADGGFQRVKTIFVEVGELSNVEPDALRFCFDAVISGSLADGATLELVCTPGRGWCVNCNAAVPMSDLLAACPLCGGYQLQVTEGTAMRVLSLEVLDDEFKERI